MLARPLMAALLFRRGCVVSVQHILGYPAPAALPCLGASRNVRLAVGQTSRRPGSSVLTRLMISGCAMNPDDPDVISFGHPRTGGSRIMRPFAKRIPWAMAALSSASLAIAIIVAVHYHGQVIALHRQMRNTPRVVVSSGTSPTITAPSAPMMSSTNIALMTAGSLRGEVTFVAANAPTGSHTNIVIIAHIRGARPHTRYALIGGSCSSRSHLQRAIGVTDAHGTGELVGRVRRVSQAATYWLQLDPAVNRLHPSLAGDFASPVSGISAYRSGPPMCGT
jgi:hypothetical protein